LNEIGAIMQRWWTKALVMSVLLLFILAVAWITPVSAGALLQIPTVSIPTVTSTPGGPSIIVKPDQEQINVRNGPGTSYGKVGVLLAGQQAPAKGRSPGGDWILIDYPGVQGGHAWVYAPLVDLTPGELPVAEPPPTPTPLYTPTIDPTLAAQFVVTSVPTRLPSFTPPPPLVIPTFTASSPDTGRGIPMGMIIIGIAAVGIFMGLFTLSQGR
jgi:hypothetical protein